MLTQESPRISISAQLSNLLLRWQELRQQGQNPAAEELCASRPHLLEELQRQIEALQSMEAILGLGADGESSGTMEATGGRPVDAPPAAPSSTGTLWTDSERFAIPGY